MKRTPALLVVPTLAAAGVLSMTVPAYAAQEPGVSVAGITYTIPVTAANGVAGL